VDHAISTNGYEYLLRGVVHHHTECVRDLHRLRYGTRLSIPLHDHSVLEHTDARPRFPQEHEVNHLGIDVVVLLLSGVGA
jgi:hypothetical protein